MKKILCVIAVFFFLSSCSMQQHYLRLDNLLKSGSCDQATDFMAKNKGEYGSNARLVFLMDSAMVNMQCGNYEEANRYFHEAEALGEELWTESVSRNAISFVSNDLVLPYAGEDFERALINLFSAICYLELEEYDEALVECRRLDTLLSGYNQEYEEKSVYKEDAFGRYLSGIIHEAAGELDDAYIDYYTAFKVYENEYRSQYRTGPSSFLRDDLLRVAKKTHRMDDALRIVPDHSYKKYRKLSLPNQSGKIVLIHLNGQSPIKVDNKIVLPSKSGPISIAFPEYVVKNADCSESQLIVKSESKKFVSDAELAEDINSIAVKSLDDRKVRVIAKALARAVAKQVAIDRIGETVAGKEKKDNQQLIKFVLNIANTLALERADTRTWRTLPGEIYISRIFVPKGSYTAYVKRCEGSPEFLESFDISTGETRFLLFNSMY